MLLLSSLSSCLPSRRLVPSLVMRRGRRRGGRGQGDGRCSMSPAIGFLMLDAGVSVVSDFACSVASPSMPRASGVSFTTGNEHRCAGSNVAIAGPSLVRPRSQVRSHSHCHSQVRSHSRSHFQGRPQRLGRRRLRRHPARNQVAHRCAVCERNRHADPAASRAGARTERKLHPVCSGPLRDLQHHSCRRVPQQ